MKAKKDKKIKLNTKNKKTEKNRTLGKRIRLMVITGEKSGELLAYDVVKELKKNSNLELWATGGELLKKEGVEIIESIDKMAVVGIIEALRSYSFLKSLLKRIINIIKEKEIKNILLVDYPGFNLRLAEQIKKQNLNVQIFYLVSPQIWAWNYKRIKKIKKNIDLMFTLFEFEKHIYDKENVPAVWVGHPMKFRIPKEIKKQNEIKIKGNPIVGVLPGSRRSEVFLLLEVMLKACELIVKDYEKAQFLIASSEESGPIFDHIQSVAKKFSNLRVQVVVNQSLRVMQQSDLLIIASGTATLEAVYFQKPMVICYKVSLMNYLLISFLIRTKFIGLPNLLAKKEVVLELIQNEFTPEYIYNEVKKILEDRNYREEMIKILKKIKLVPLNQNPAKIVAENIIQFKK